MPSASSVTAPSYALAAGAKPATSRAMSSVSKDDITATQVSTVSSLTLSSSAISTVTKDAASLSSTGESLSTTPTIQEPLANGKPTDVSNKDKDASSTSTAAEESLTSSVAGGGASSSSSSSTTSTATESVSSIEATATVSQKPSLTPAPLPKVNVWKVRQETISPRSVVSSVDPTPAELSSVVINGDNERKSSKSSIVADLDSKDWPTALEEDSNAEKKDNASKPPKRQGKEKWVPYTPALIVPTKSNRSGKPFSSRSNNSARSGSTGNTEGSNSGEEHNGRGNKNFVRGNRPKNGSSLNGTLEKKSTSTSSASNSTENKDPKTWHKKHHEKKDPIKDEKDENISKDRATRSAGKELSQSALDPPNNSAATQPSQAQPQGRPANTSNYQPHHLSQNQASIPSSQSSEQSGSEQSSALPNQESSYYQAHQSHHSPSNQFSQASASIPQSKAVPPPKNRTQRPYNNQTNGTHQPSGHGSQPINRGPRNNEYHNIHATTNGQSPVGQSGQQGPYQNSRTTPNGTRNTSPRSIHSNPQFQQHFSGYQPHHNNHHNNYNQIRRASAVNVSTFQPAARQFYAPQQDYAAMFAFPQAFPSQPALIPGYIYEPANPVTAQVEYYFSLENLCKDIYLRRNMNSDGLVPLSLLAGFNRIKSLINGDVNILTEACRQSHNAEVVGNKVRSREHWSNFVMPFHERLPPGQEEEGELSVIPTSTPTSSKVIPVAATHTMTTQEASAVVPGVATPTPVTAAATE
ncbi:hypothetical protein V1508DRAFT_404455 [Lipomyces doorenjongii]|uniref:uncharacterized protein n=1 Tax=Lipomyces doorenjongii TaxID=383834 RepID=UPI0034CDD164